MKYIAGILIISACLFGCQHRPSPAQSAEDNFSLRAAAGNDASQTEQGKRYMKSYGRFVGEAMRACIPPGSSDPANLGTFVFVGYVNMAGQIAEAEVQPITKVSGCFASEFSKINLPVPPQENRTSFGYPIKIPMSIKP